MDITSEGLGEMFKGDFADKCTNTFPLMLMGGQVESLACADTGARFPIMEIRQIWKEYLHFMANLINIAQIVLILNKNKS